MRKDCTRWKYNMGYTRMVSIGVTELDGCRAVDHSLDENERAGGVDMEAAEDMKGAG